MKSIPPRTRPPVQTELFDSALSPLPQASLEQAHDELVDLLSQLLLQVVCNADAVQLRENSDEQDQP